MAARRGSWKLQYWESSLGASIQAPPRAPLAVARKRGWEDLLSQRQPSEKDHTVIHNMDGLQEFQISKIYFGDDVGAGTVCATRSLSSAGGRTRGEYWAPR